MCNRKISSRRIDRSFSRSSTTIRGQLLLLLLFLPAAPRHREAYGLCSRRNAAPMAAMYEASRASSALGQWMLPVVRNRRCINAGHRSRTWLGVSCSSLQRGQSPPRHAASRHPSHPGTGFPPMRCRYCADPDQ